MSDPTRTVCVTGASSFIGSWVVAYLLERGYWVRGTVRALGRQAHLTSLPGAPERLSLFSADLLDGPAAFGEAMEGCSGVIHCASPFFFESSDPARELIAPAVEGTRAVLRAALAAPLVRKVVLTSSMAAVYVSTRRSDHVHTEEDWSDLAHVRATSQHYAESKLLAEREAWRILAEEQPPGRGLLLATICPSQCLGPLMQPYLNTSARAVVEHADGSKALAANRSKGFVDVRDVALAHILALEGGAAPTACGRFMLMSTSLPWARFCTLLRQALGPVDGARVPTAVEEGPPCVPQAITSIKRAWDLGVRYRPIEDSIADCAVSVRDKGFLRV